MWSILKGEWRKLRRCQILLVGIVALALCPVVQYGTQLIINPEMRDQNFDFVKLFANVIWGNTQIFLPISLVMIGGWLIDRENTNDTMKNLLTVPVSYPQAAGRKTNRHDFSVTAVRSLQCSYNGFDRLDCRPGWSFCRRSASAGRAGGRGRFQYQPGLYADDSNFRPDAGCLPRRFDSDILPGVLHLVLQERLPAFRLPVFGGVDPCRF